MDLSSLSLQLPYMALGLSLIVLILVAWIIHLETRIRRLTRGKNGADLEEVFAAIEKDIRDLEKFRGDMEQYLSRMEERVRRSVQGVGTVRFNAFEGTGEGGQQSFATALLNEDGNGVVISSIRARDRVGIYAKPIAKHSSEYELTGEEKEAIEKAKTT